MQSSPAYYKTLLQAPRLTLLGAKSHCGRAGDQEVLSGWGPDLSAGNVVVLLCDSTAVCVNLWQGHFGELYTKRLGDEKHKTFYRMSYII